VFVSAILHLLAYILQVQQEFSIKCGRPLVRTFSRYRSYPRIVGETGGKDFVMVHPSADPDDCGNGLAQGSI